jgi:flagellar hook assembly protein FlgD
VVFVISSFVIFSVGTLTCSTCPNPIFAGSGLFVYLNDLDHNQNDVFVDIYSGEGKRVKTIQIVAKEGVYQIDKSISEGNYYAVLRKGDNVLEREKLVIY